MKYAIYGLLAVAVLLAFMSTVMTPNVSAPNSPGIIGENFSQDPVACTMDAMVCPDGSYVGRTGPNCEFVCPASSTVLADVNSGTTTKSDKIVLVSPVAGAIVQTPLTLTGQARGNWFFEASFPVSLKNGGGLVIAEGVATAEGDSMTTEFVPFTATLTFTNPYKLGDLDFMKQGTLILKKDNPSGLPTNDEVLEIPVRFAE